MNTENVLGFLTIGALAYAAIDGVRSAIKKRPTVFGAATDPLQKHGNDGEEKVDAALREQGIPTLRNVFLQSWKEHVTELDLVALIGTSITVIEVKAWTGDVRGRTDDAEWSQVKGHQVKMMGNPLLQNRYHALHARRHLPRAHIAELVVFTEGMFPEGQPEGVVDIPGLLEYVGHQRTGEPDSPTMLAWGKLASISGRQDKQLLREKLLSQVRLGMGAENNGDDNITVVV
ncbi:MAG: NERD domain-containing protein [Desulfovibrio sp.]|uniref:nuclease-related domain-containing protein n=1 Tax=Desulfovibrio sp. TaxID=885 RepID=UPI00135D3DDD|nr:nuclease-related domain-containing protein [Desulfovibrio sp.]MTJ93932.1 NERD domain-containing protein [Desulfovibrio sp.]